MARERLKEFFLEMETTLAKERLRGFIHQDDDLEKTVWNRPARDRFFLEKLMKDGTHLAVVDKSTIEEEDDWLSFVVTWPGPGLTLEHPYHNCEWEILVLMSDVHYGLGPLLTFETKIYHPNVDADTGKVAIAGSRWNPNYDLTDVFGNMLPFLLIHPCTMGAHGNKEAQALYEMHDKSHFHKRVAEYIKKYGKRVIKNRDEVSMDEEDASSGDDGGDSKRGERIDRELSALMEKADLGNALKVVSVDKDRRQIIVEFRGPRGCAYYRGTWKIRLELTDDYPSTIPSVVFLNKIFHPNIDEASGTVCADVFKEGWFPAPICNLTILVHYLLPRLLLYPTLNKFVVNDEAMAMLKYPNRGDAFDKRVEEYVLKYATPSHVDAAEEKARDDDGPTMGQGPNSIMSQGITYRY